MLLFTPVVINIGEPWELEVKSNNSLVRGNNGF